MSDIINRFLKEEEIVSTSEKYLTFSVDSQSYAIPITDVKEIISVQEITKMPDFPEYIKGIINVRGTIIPIIDIRLRFKKQEIAYTNRTSIVITIINDLQIGLIVDLVSEVLDIEYSDISPAPRMKTESTNKYVTSVGKVNDRMILILDTDKILNYEELAGIADMID